MPITERADKVLQIQAQLGRLTMQVPPPPDHAPDQHKLGYQEMGLSFQHACSIASHLRRHGPDFAASAFALARPMLETLQRGWWFSVCATDEQAATFIATDRFDFGQVEVGKAIDAVEPFIGTNFFSGLDKAEWKIYHSFTHGGLFALDAYANRPNLVADYDPTKLLILLDNVQRMSGMAAIGMAWIGKIYDPKHVIPLYQAIHALGVPREA